MNIPDHIAVSLETILLKILKLFDADQDLGSGVFFTLNSGSGMEKFGPVITYRIRNTAN
jgi:hypothetical protein